MRDSPKPDAMEEEEGTEPGTYEQEIRSADSTSVCQNMSKRITWNRINTAWKTQANMRELSCELQDIALKL